MKHPCPCCGFLTFSVPAREDTGFICPVCFWENDPFLQTDVEPSDSNHGLSLWEGRENFKSFGACEPSMLRYVPPPRREELPEGGRTPGAD